MRALPINRALIIYIFLSQYCISYTYNPILKSLRKRIFSMQQDYTNDLINETSPYLLQHAHNPVNWNAWNEESRSLASREDKLILISIGYSSCHWCHVMEHESFEDETVAKVMNEHYINIKVDREERPDVDNVYMSAVQLITGQGGWPLNVIALPDGRPVWGGTYFPKDAWINALTQIADLYTKEPNKVIEYAQKLSQGLNESAIITPNSDAENFKQETINSAIAQWSRHWDTRKGGLNRAPKFMMPTNYHFLLRYAQQTEDVELMEYVNTTLEQMAYGGIKDHIGGGFARYSVDDKWHIPHFEKMLYDNGQLVSLYSDAYIATKNPLYKETVIKTLDFVSREMTTPEGGFYSALDADSLTKEGKLEEGAYYVWTKDELKNLLDKDLALFEDYYNVNEYGYWENGNYVLIRNQSDEAFIEKHHLSQKELDEKKQMWGEVLVRFRESTKKRPRLDDKILTSWNALMTKGYIDAYRAFKNPSYLNTALKNAEFIVKNAMRSDNGLNRTYKNGKSTINAYLEDYAATIEAFIALFQVTGDAMWLTTSKLLTDYTVDHFQNPENKMFYFTSDQDPSLATRTIEYTDNVIPASNSKMAKNIFYLSRYFSYKTYLDTARAMLHNVQEEFERSPSSFSNWLDLMANLTMPFYEIVIVGSNADDVRKEFENFYMPNILIAVSLSESEIPIFKGRYIENKTLIYVCVNSTCKLPVSTVSEALELLEN